ncbi:MAG: hypothetical protein PVF59_07195 [Desulfobacterales bacterium]|jgi:hypothetical protein
MPLRNLALIVGALAGTLAAGFLPTPRQAQWLFEHGAYYFLLALVAAWTLKGWSLYGHHLKTWGPRRLAALVLAAVLTVMIFIHSPPRFKILADESNLVGLSMMMHSERVAAVPIEGFVTDQRQADLVTAPDKRPLLFPFLVSVIHTLIGYSPSNGFLLNFATTLAALLSFALAASRLFGPAMALPSILMLASAPILSFYATGSGFEILNMLFMMLTFMVLLEVVDSEAAPDRVELLFLTALMLAHCRYESAIVLVLLALFLAYRLIRWGRWKQLSGLGCLLPVFLLPILWQRRIFMGAQMLNRVDYDVLQAKTNPFNWSYLIDHIDDNLFVLLGLNPDYGFTFPMALLALLGTYLLLRNALRGRPLPIAPLPLSAVAASLMALLLIISAYYWGNFGLTEANRLAVVFLPFVALAALGALHRIQQHLRFDSQVVVIVLLVAHLLYFWPYAGQQRLLNTLSLPFEYQRVTAYLKKAYPEDHRLLIIAELPNLYIIQPHSAVTIGRLNEITPRIRRQRAHFDHIIALQKIDRRTGEITPPTFIGPPVQLIPRQEIPITTLLSLRVSECHLPGDPS